MTTKKNNNCVYKITCKETGHNFMSYTSNIEKAWARLRRVLRKGEHENPRFQGEWAKYGEACFGIEVVSNHSTKQAAQKKVQRLIDEDGLETCYQLSAKMKKENRELDIEMFEAQFGPCDISGIDYYPGWQQKLIRDNDLAGFKD